jgi:hypothetical protein
VRSGAKEAGGKAGDGFWLRIAGEVKAGAIDVAAEDELHHGGLMRGEDGAEEAGSDFRGAIVNKARVRTGEEAEAEGEIAKAFPIEIVSELARVVAIALAIAEEAGGKLIG